MRLSELFRNIKDTSVQNIALYTDPEVISVCCDSRDVSPGDIFIAIKGLRVDGHDFIDEAINRGAIAVVCQNEVRIAGSVPCLKVENTKKYLAKVACTMNANPSAQLSMIGITGTNGKTTTSYIIERIMQQAGYDPGVIGTINHRFKSFAKDHSSTTPDSLVLQSILKDMLKSKVTHVVMEVSSHALEQYRVYGCKFNVAVFTNLTQDHLDYHRSMEKYWNAKRKLFTKHLSENGVAIVNNDDYRGKSLARSLSGKVRVVRTGSAKECDIRPVSFTCSSAGTRGKILTPIGEFSFNSSLVGGFNLSNILSATGACVAMGIPLIDISVGINATLRIPGRLELINTSIGILVYIDYAHTPDALENVMRTIRLLSKGRMITIFGCGGNRDSSKRGKMGKIAAELGDLSIVTSDNPRFEDSMTIINQIISGVCQVCSNRVDKKTLLLNEWSARGYAVIPDRKEAIFVGIRAAGIGDTVLIAGKGHETYQMIGDNIFKFDDKKEAEKVLKTIVR